MNLFIRESVRVKADNNEIYEYGSRAGFTKILVEHGSSRYTAG